MAVTVRVAEKSRDTKSTIDQILCRYCRAHCEASIHDPPYERTDCPPRISDQELARRRWSPATKTTPDAHNKTCPGLGEVGSVGPCTSQRHILEPPSDKGTTTLTSKLPDKAGSVFTDTRVVRTATAYGQYGASTSTDDHNPMRPRKRKCDGQGEEHHDSDSKEGGIVRKARPVDKSKTSKTLSSSNEIQIDHNQNMMKLPNGISLVTVARPGPGQPIRIKLPLTEPNQNWCTIRVNVPEHVVTCPESDLALSVKVLKKTADLAETEKTTVRIPITTQGEVQSFGVYAIPGLGTHAFVGPFTSKQERSSDDKDSSVGHCSETKEFD
jgi:hypothetical protein